MASGVDRFLHVDALGETESFVQVALCLFLFAGAADFVAAVNASHFARFTVLSDFVFGDPFACFCAHFCNRVSRKFFLKIYTLVTRLY